LRQENPGPATPAGYLRYATEAVVDPDGSDGNDSHEGALDIGPTLLFGWGDMKVANRNAAQDETEQ
jgi:hypothetical protein